MKKNKHIFSLAALFFVFALVKYAFIKNELPTSFIVFEVLSFMVILYGVYYLLHCVETCLQGHKEADCERECSKRQADIERLKVKLAAYESKIDDEQKEGVNKGELSALLTACLSSDADNREEALLGHITDHCEVMAAIAYRGNLDEGFSPVAQFGVDEDYTLPPLNLDDGLHAQAVKDRQAMELGDIPADYIEVGSATGQSKPVFIYILPFVGDDNKGFVLEVATFKKQELATLWQQLVSA
ncbi:MULTISPECIES: hypothetical protein [unclassified Carboxylicivirga]|uniref:hypothetical protein n=1 Tax=Carboxylicivirga TaxID=1628153 RepID=UPI003D3344EE